MDEDAWTDRVREAVMADDPEHLRQLYDQAKSAWGLAEASTRWSLVLSAYDAGAQTG